MEKVQNELLKEKQKLWEERKELQTIKNELAFKN